MSSAHDFQHNIDASIEAVRGRSLPAMANMVSLAGIAWGVLALVGGLATTPEWTWGAVLVATFYAICIGQGAFMFAIIMHGTMGRWGRPLKRVAESMVIGLIFVALPLLVVFLIGGMGVYEWHPNWFGGTPVDLEPHGVGALAAKPIWLSSGFFQARQIGGLVLLIVLDLFLLRRSLLPDLIIAKAKLGADAPAWWDRVIGGATDAKAEMERSSWWYQPMVPIMAMTYALVMSMFAFDMVMSLDAWWFSNMFGGWVFMSSILLGLCALAVASTLGRDWLGLTAWIKPNVTHDLGKLMLAGTMFWAYTLFAQILPIYYTDVPEETNFLLVRMVLPQWSWMARTVAVLCFVAPFTILLSRGLKKMRWPFFGLACLILTGLFFERTLLVMPSVYRGEDFPMMPFLGISFGLFALVLGGLVQSVGRFLAQVPAVPIADPLLADHPWDVHVHASGLAHEH